jgi:hypothetical protein
VNPFSSSRCHYRNHKIPSRKPDIFLLTDPSDCLYPPDTSHFDCLYPLLSIYSISAFISANLQIDFPIVFTDGKATAAAAGNGRRRPNWPAATAAAAAPGGPGAVRRVQTGPNPTGPALVHAEWHKEEAIPVEVGEIGTTENWLII